MASSSPSDMATFKLVVSNINNIKKAIIKIELEFMNNARTDSSYKQCYPIPSPRKSIAENVSGSIPLFGADGADDDHSSGRTTPLVGDDGCIIDRGSDHQSDKTLTNASDESIPELSYYSGRSTPRPEKGQKIVTPFMYPSRDEIQLSRAFYGLAPKKLNARMKPLGVNLIDEIRGDDATPKIVRSKENRDIGRVKSMPFCSPANRLQKFKDQM